MHQQLVAPVVEQLQRHSQPSACQSCSCVLQLEKRMRRTKKQIKKTKPKITKLRKQLEREQAKNGTGALLICCCCPALRCAAVLHCKRAACIDLQHL